MIPAGHIFFPAAALFAALSPWLLTLSISYADMQIVDSITHAKGMLFGYTGALIAGYLLGKTDRIRLLALFILWLLGRIIEVFSDSIILTNLSYSLFGILLALLIAPKFLVAKKWRNLAMVPLITAIGSLPFITWLLESTEISTNIFPHTFILLITLLMYFIGGRLITPMATRAFADSGMKIPQRVQPALESSTIILISLACILSININFQRYAGMLAGMAAVLILVRLYRWKLHALSRRHIDLLALAVGYGWLALGLLVYSVSLVTFHSTTPSLHLITIGAIGLLSSSIMLRTMASGNRPAFIIWLLSILLVSTAVICRFSMSLATSHWHLLLNLTALCWSLNFMIVFIYCINCLLIRYRT